MNKQFTVFSVHHQPAEVEVTLADGSPTTAIVSALEIQLTPLGDGDGTLKLVYTSTKEIETAKADFPVGTTVTVSFAANPATAATAA